MTDTAIKVKNLSKRYRIGQKEERHDTLFGALKSWMVSPLGNFRRLQKLSHFEDSEDSGEIIWALKDVSFEVKHGEVVGIIGRNGAGKSTLLKILSHITEPTSGRAVINGRVASLLEVGTGFHPELTGRENIYLNSTILGMTKQEVDRKFDEIVAFSEVEKFIDTPVKRYSSGMKVRLAFSVAAHLDPEILMIDEVLSVGDIGFQKKCLGKMGEVAKRGRTILFVSHNMAAVQSFCDRIVLIDNGRIIKNGAPKSTIMYYIDKIIRKNITEIPLLSRTDRTGNGKVRLTAFHIEETNGIKIAAARSGMDLDLVFGYECNARQGIQDVDIGFSFHSIEGLVLTILYSSFTGIVFKSIPFKGEFRCRITDFPFPSGKYMINARVTVKGQEADQVNNGIGYLIVEEGDFFGSGAHSRRFTRQPPLFLLKGDWGLKP